MHEIWQAAIDRAVAEWHSDLPSALDVGWIDSPFERATKKADSVIALARKILDAYKASSLELCTPDTPSVALEDGSNAAKEITDCIRNWASFRVSEELRTPHGILRTDLYEGALKQRLDQIERLTSSLCSEIAARTSLGHQKASRLEADKVADTARAVAREKRESREHWPKLLQSYTAVISYFGGIISLFFSFVTGAFHQLQSGATGFFVSVLLLAFGWLLQHMGRHND